MTAATPTGPGIALRLRAARHELTCWECRVTWTSWALRLVGIAAGYTPKTGRTHDREGGTR